ncbi:MAG: hypothetical protein H7Z75_03370 [Ferruginibacter sp.]|nr:hypothetical protein [Cytophagales bacterium]
MHRLFWTAGWLFLPSCSLAQFARSVPPPSAVPARLAPPVELYTRGYGAIVGVQQGRYTFLELGGEANWRTVTLSHPRTYGVGGNLEYNFGRGVLGWKAFGWVRPGRIDFSYGANLVYYTDFDRVRFGIGPSLGYKLLGFHLLAGANLLAGNRAMTSYNPFYFTIRYYAPIQKKTGFRRSK